MTHRITHHAATLALVVLALTGEAGWAQTPDEVEEAIRAAAATHGANATQLVRVARCESGLNPRAVGRLGEQGLFQIRPGYSMAQLWQRWGYDDVWDAYQQADFAARAFVAGYSSHWSCR